MVDFLNLVIVKWPDVAAGTLATIVAGALVALARHGTYKPLICTYKAGRIRVNKGSKIGILVCEFEGDTNGRLSKIVRSNIKTNYPSAKDAPLLAISFPLSLPAVSTSDEDDSRNERKAKRWLNETNCDVIIWGERLDDTGTSIIKVLGRQSESAKLIDVKLQVGAGEFNELVADAITREVIEAQTRAFEDPKSIDIEYLRLIADKCKRLVRSEMVGFTASTVRRIRESLDVLLTEICKRSSHIPDWDDALANSSRLIKLYPESWEEKAKVEAVVRYASHLRRRAWAGMDLGEVRDGLELVAKALQATRKEKEMRDASDLLTSNAEFFKAILNRDAAANEFDLDINVSLKIIRKSNDRSAKNIASAFVVSRYPLVFFNCSRSSIKPGWVQKAWTSLKGNMLPYDLSASVLDSIVEEQFDAGYETGSTPLLEDLVRFLLEIEQNSKGMVRVFWLISFCAYVSAILKREGLDFFRSKFPGIYIVGKIENAADELLALATTFRTAYYIQYSSLHCAASALSAIEGVLGTGTEYSRSESAFLKAISVAEVHYSHRVKDTTLELCAHINTLSRISLDKEKAQRSIELLQEHNAEGDAFGCYLLSFAYLSRSGALANEQSKRLTSERKELALEDAHRALELSEIGLCLPNDRGWIGVERLKRAKQEAKDFIKTLNERPVR